MSAVRKKSAKERQLHCQQWTGWLGKLTREKVMLRHIHLLHFRVE
jgi:hypothetical protein